VTHIFLAGDIIATHRTDYGPQAGISADARVPIMQKQHQDAMRALIAGRHDATLAARGIALTPVPART
jgi:hypothetical protein